MYREIERFMGNKESDWIIVPLDDVEQKHKETNGVLRAIGTNHEYIRSKVYLPRPSGRQ
jgi:hypothetical protein